MITDFARGFMTVLQSWPLLFAKGLKRYTLIPVMANVLLFVLFFYFAGHQVAEITQTIQQHLPSWLAWLSYMSWLVYGLLAMMLLTYGFAFFGSIIFSPICGLLAECTENLLSDVIEDKAHQPTFWQMTQAAFSREWHKLKYTLPRTCGLLILFVTPGLQLFAPSIALFVSAWLIAFQTLDFSFDNHHHGLEQLKQSMNQNKALSLGFGFGLLFFASIPVLNIFVIPLSIIAAAKLYLWQLSPTKTRRK